MDVSRDLDVCRAHSRDASGLELIPEGVVRASTVQDVVEALELARGLHTSITPAGSQTSMTASSITDRGLLLSLRSMAAIIDVDPEVRTARVQPGITIGDLNRSLRETGLQFAPDPTSEDDATIGGAIACNASGARSLFYGATRQHVGGVVVVHANGEVASYSRTDMEKNTVGFSAAQDPVDWFVGSEGTLGVVVEAELLLVEAPVALIGLAIPFASQSAALNFVVSVRSRPARDAFAPRRARCLEFFDAESVRIAGAAIQREWPADLAAMIYLEDDCAHSSVEAVLESWLEIAEVAGADVGDIRVYEGAQALRQARLMRHAVPSTINERGSAFIPEGGRKISTDWAVPYPQLGEALGVSGEAVRKHGAPTPVTYGHAGNGHPHQNFVAEDSAAVERTNAAVKETLLRVIEMGGTVSAEHGLGKLKRAWAPLQLRPRQLDVMRAMKHALDPSGMFAPGNVFE